jgi:hypothetical protein
LRDHVNAQCNNAFAAALAAEEDPGLDLGLLYVAALLHDSGLFSHPGRWRELLLAAGAHNPASAASRSAPS